MKKRQQLVARAVTIFFLLAAVANGGEASPAAKTYEGVLPGTIVAHVTTLPLREIMQNIEAFAIAAAEGTPAALQIQPGFLNMVLAISNPLPPGLLDMDQPLQLFVCCTKPLSEQPPEIAALLPMGDFKEKLEHAKGLNFAVEELDGFLRITNPMNNLAFALVDAGKGYVAVSDSPAAANEAAAQFKAWEQKPPPAGTPPTAVLTIDIGKIFASNQQTIGQKIAELQEKIDRDEIAAIKNAPPQVQAAYKLLPRYLQTLTNFLGDIRSARVYLNIDNTNLRLSAYLTPKADTAFQRFAKAYASADVKYEQARYLPPHSAMVACGQMLAEGQTEFLPFFKSLLSDFGGTLIDKSFGDNFSAQIEKCATSFQGHMVSAFTLPTEADAPIKISYSTVKDPVGCRKAISELCGSLGAFVNGMLGLMPIPLPMQFGVDFVENAGTINGVPFSAMKGKVALREGTDATALPPDAAQALAHMRAMMERNVQRLTVVENTLVMVEGGNDEKALAAAVQALRNKTEGMGADAAFQENLNAAGNKQILFACIYPLDMIKALVMQMATVARDMDQPNNPLVDPNLAAVVRELPDSSSPISMAIGAKETKKEDEKGETLLYSLTANAILPAKAISETGIALTGLIARMQAGMHGDDGGIPLEEMEAEDEEPADEEDGEEEEEQNPKMQTF